MSCALTNLRIGLESQGVGARVAMFNRRGESKARALLSRGRPITSKKMRMFAAVGIGYASKSVTRRLPTLPARRVSKR